MCRRDWLETIIGDSLDTMVGVPFGYSGLLELQCAVPPREEFKSMSDRIANDTLAGAEPTNCKTTFAAVSRPPRATPPRTSAEGRRPAP